MPWQDVNLLDLESLSGKTSAAVVHRGSVVVYNPRTKISFEGDYSRAYQLAHPGRSRVMSFRAQDFDLVPTTDVFITHDELGNVLLYPSNMPISRNAAGQVVVQQAPGTAPYLPVIFYRQPVREFARQWESGPSYTLRDLQRANQALGKETPILPEIGGVRPKAPK